MNPTILVLDNYDSFTYNLVHIIRALGFTVDIYRNDKISLDAVGAYDKILLSPGPGIPSEAGILCDVIRTYAPSKSIFGVCLGHQAIGEVFGGTLINLDKVYHGIATPTHITTTDILFNGMPTTFTTGRYHSWAVKAENFPDTLEVTAVDDKGAIMALRHRQYDVRGVQFHPESILTEQGEKIVANWLQPTAH
ncbi:MAG: aminodeoxychorismate/anthranilate synthase component II [Cytophagaceae bacterium]|jgi:anthranilate synthase component 2|nr:aminodeoxychorismate/anthranilate synthase component II [Cytophagaceae bacterium]